MNVLKKRFNLCLSNKLDQELTEMAEGLQISRTDLVRKALALFKIGYEANKRGESLGIVKDGKIKTQIVGLN